jgi:hypothetical protein
MRELAPEELELEGEGDARRAADVPGAARAQLDARNAAPADARRWERCELALAETLGAATFTRPFERSRSPALGRAAELAATSGPDRWVMPGQPRGRSMIPKPSK